MTSEEGLVMDERDFMSLNHKRQHLVMYRTLIANHKTGKYNQWKQRIIIGWLTGITTVGAWLAQKIWLIR
jgi:hypothetical protein